MRLAIKRLTRNALIFLCLLTFGVLSGGSLTAQAQGVEYDDCLAASIHDITSELKSAGIIYSRDVKVTKGYTNGRTCIDSDNYSFYGVSIRYISGNYSTGGTIRELVLNTSKVAWDGIDPTTLRNADYYRVYKPEVAWGPNQAPVWYAIKSGRGTGDDWYTWWVGARGMVRYWGYKDSAGKYHITHIVAQTKCTAGLNNYGEWPIWHRSPNDGGYCSDWWGGSWSNPLWGWDGGRLVGGWGHKCPGHTVYTYDVNEYVNGTNSTAKAGTFSVTKNGASEGTGLTDYYKNNTFRAGVKLNVSDVAANDGYVYQGNDSYSTTISSDTEIKLPFKTKYSVSYDKGKTDQDIEMPDSDQLIWDSDLTLPTVDGIRGRDVTITFDENPGTGSSTPTEAEDIDTTLETAGWSINSKTYEQGEDLTAPKFSSQPNGRVTATMSYLAANFELPEISRTGYDFDGWFTRQDSGEQVTSITVEPDTTAYEQTVYAHWSARTYTLTYDANNPETALVDESDIQMSKTSQTAKYDSAWGPLATASKPGYTFLGWYTEAKGGTRITASTICHGNQTAYAHWAPIQYTIRFHPNAENGEGTVEGTMPSITLTYDRIQNLPANTYEKTTLVPAEDEGGSNLAKESIFRGWSTVKESLTPSLADKAPILNMTRNDGDIIDLYAIWDDAPKFILDAYPDRYFTVAEAQSGLITEEELLSTVIIYDRETNPLPHKTTEEVEAGDDVGVSVVGFDPDEFTSVTDDSVITIRYKVKDENGNETFLNINVWITRNGKMPPAVISYLRSIDERYTEIAAVYGGLSDTSRWKTDEAYQQVLDEAFDDEASGTTYRLGKSQLNEIRSYVKTNGFGNSSSSDGLAEIWNILGE